MRCARNHANALPLAGILLVHAGLLAYSAARHSPTFNELGHVPAGICHWQYAMFELYRVNPPLARMVATAPLLFLDPKTDWGNYQLDPLSRETIPMGIRFAKANGPRTFFSFTVARWACIPFCLLGAWTCYRWTGDLWGPRAGWLAILLWCFNPFVLGFGALVKPDVPAAAVGVWAAYRFWKWLREPSWSAAAVAGLALGLAELTKFTLLVFFLLWPAAWLVKRVSDRRGAYCRTEFIPFASSVGWRTLRLEMLQSASILFLAVLFINLGYAFAGSFQRLGEYRFQSRVLSGQSPPPTLTRSASKARNSTAQPPLTRSASKAENNHAPRPGNRFAKTWIAGFPVPLPRDYVQGIDRQRTDFELGERSYLCGEWQDHGWWYYHLFGLAIKTPLGTLALLCLTMGLTLSGAFRRVVARRHRSHQAPHEVPAVRSAVQIEDAPSPTRFADEVFLLAPAVAILALVSSQTGFSNHVRYTIPALPYLFIWCGKCLAVAQGVGWPSQAVQTGRRPRKAIPRGAQWLTIACWTCIAATIVGSLFVYPHSISFFNQFVGGPENGHQYLLESNIACGQDSLFLKEWCDRHPEARPLGVASFGWIDPELARIEYNLPPVGPPNANWHAGAAPPSGNSDELGPLPGWYAIDVNFLHGTHWPAPCLGWHWWNIDPAGPNFEYFRFFEPCDRVAYSFLIYHITTGDANRVRRELGLPALAE